MKSHIKIKKTTIHSDYVLMNTQIVDGLLEINLADRYSEDRVRLQLYGEETLILLRQILLNDPNPIPKMHELFRAYPRLKQMLTEALLTFDTEAGGQTMNLQAAPAEKEEQP